MGAEQETSKVNWRKDKNGSSGFLGINADKSLPRHIKRQVELRLEEHDKAVKAEDETTVKQEHMSEGRS